VDEDKNPINTGRLLLFAFLALSLGVFESDGFYSKWALRFTLAGFVAFLIAVVLIARGRQLGLPSERGLAGGLVLLLVLGTLKKVGYHVSDPAFDHYVRVAGYALAGAVAIAFVFLRTPRLRLSVFLIGVITAVALRIGMLRATPLPDIDVYELAQQSSGYLLHGFNPYSSPLWASGRTGNVYAFEGYAYLPGNLLLQSVMFALTSEARYANLLADVAFAGSIWLTTRQIAVAHRQLLVLLFLFQPRALFMLENAWTDSLTLGLLGVCVWLWRSKRASAAAAVCGFLLTMKQYLVFVAPQYLILDRRVKSVLILLGAGLATVLPFILWDPASFWKNGVMLVVSLPFHNSTLTLASFLNRLSGWTPGPALSIVSGLVSMAGFPLLLRRVPQLPRFLLCSTGTLFTTFLFGTKAFVNYYYLVSGLMVLALALHAEPTKTAPAASS
jgi:hypothetical protein